MDSSIEFKVWGRFALFTDPLTKIGGEKCSYHVPTYEALKGIARSIYWKPTFIWIIDRVRVMKRIRTQAKGMKPRNYAKEENSLALYNYLVNVEYQVQAHFEWNKHLSELEEDRSEGKHRTIAKRMLERGGRRDIFLGTRECQGYAEPCAFGEEKGEFDGYGELAFGLMFHSFKYPEELGVNELHSYFWMPCMANGVIEFPRTEQCPVSKFVREMAAQKFIPNVNFTGHKEKGLLA
ncbi:MAG: type I-C CRISPR-associated protein Cas5c [Synergistaceae bacterium]|jgi:CRISPR-associated protein Cas5d|nr:type I-C CRISPR-associated protein Cas5c [Synergistaceae bacterium]